MHGTVSIVTGASAGIGKATAIGLARGGAIVVMACRTAEKGHAAAEEVRRASGSSDVHMMLLDLASQTSIRGFAHDFRERFQRLDILINNAGVAPRTRRLTADGLEMQFGVNHLGHFLLTALLLPLLEQSAPSRIVIVASEAHRSAKMEWDDLQSEARYGQFRAYSRSKLANLLFMRALARRTRRVTVNAVHPGTVATEIFRSAPAFVSVIAKLFFKSPEEGARTTLYVATASELEGVTGKYFKNCRESQPSRAALDENSAERLWHISEQLTGIAPGVVNQES